MIKDILNHNATATAGRKEMEALRQYFPQCFDAEGAFNMEAFRAALPGGTTLTDETSGFSWLGKSYARMLCNMDTTTLIRPDTEHNALPENRNSQNVYISGDNLDALQHLVKSYSGRVKVIYIDPPYNTGSDGFVYNDKFNFTADDLAHRLDISPERAERILSMTRRGSASHAAWLTFMLPRLSFARDLLTDDGVIFISIDDNEQANLKKLCDEVFGEENFVAQFIWERAFAPKNDAKFVSNSHDYVLMYSKNIDMFNIGRLPRTKEADARYSNPDNDPRGPWSSGDISVKTYNAENDYKIKTPSGREVEPPTGRCWRLSRKAFRERLQDNRIWFGPNGDGVPRLKRFLTELKFDGMAPTSILHYKEVGHSQEGAKEVNILLGAGAFDGPKPVRLIERLLALANLQEDSIVIDFFGGSSSTAHAVMAYNMEKTYHLKYILVQLQEPTKLNSPAAQAGYKTIDEIGMERIKRAAKKIREENPLYAGDLGFKHYTLEEPAEDALQRMEEFNPDTNLLSELSVDTFGLETVLRTWLVADGYGLTDDAEEVMLGNYKAYWKGDHLYMITDKNFDKDSITALVDKYNGTDFSPHNIVIFGYSFGFALREELQKNLRTLRDGNKTLTVNIDIRY